VNEYRECLLWRKFSAWLIAAMLILVLLKLASDYRVMSKQDSGESAGKELVKP
jgi:hypothetical protein